MYLFFAYFSLIVINTILSLFSEKEQKNNDYEKANKDENKLKTMPENQVSLLSKLWFWWLNDLIKTGFQRDLVRDDLWQIEETETSNCITQRLEDSWNKKANDYITKVRQNPELEKPPKKEKPKKIKNKNYKTDDVNKDEEIELNATESSNEKTVEVEIKNGKYLKKPSLGISLCKVFGGKFLAGSFIKFVQDCFLFTGPFLLDKLISFIKDREQNILVGLFYTALLFICSLIQSFVLQHYFHRMFIVGTRIRTALMNVIYKKSLKLSTSARKLATVGEMTNLLAVNAQSFAELTTYLNILWSAPFQICVCVVGLWRYLGAASLFGVGTMVFFIPLNLMIGI